MKYYEFGQNNKTIMILLHGGGLSWWNYREVANILQDIYHVIIPILNGHAHSDKAFTSIEDNAEEIITFIDDNFDSNVELIGGLSLGGQIAIEIISKRNTIAKYALIESASIIPSPITNSLISPLFSSSYKLISNRHFAKLQFDALHIKQDLFEDYYQDTSLITKDNLINFTKASTSYSLKDTIKTNTKVHIFYGTKETKNIIKSSKLLHEKIIGSELHILSDMYHGEFSINHPDLYAKTIRKIIT